MDYKYDEQLNKIEQLSLHPTLLPFVGDKYDECRILQIGESHYIHQSYEEEKYNIQYFYEKWWVSSCKEMINDNDGWADTRGVLSEYIKGNNGRDTIFTNFIKSFSKIVLDRPIDHISLEDKGLYQYVAFMNFFQMPSIYEGYKYWDSLWASAKKIGNKQLAYDMWNISVEKSIETLDIIIDVLKPKAIVFTSVSAGDAYKNHDGKYKSDSRIIYTSHPGYPYTWCKKLNRFDGKRGIDVLEDGLTQIYKNS